MWDEISAHARAATNGKTQNKHRTSEDCQRDGGQGYHSSGSVKGNVPRVQQMRISSEAHSYSWKGKGRRGEVRARCVVRPSNKKRRHGMIQAAERTGKTERKTRRQYSGEEEGQRYSNIETHRRKLFGHLPAGEKRLR